MGAQGPWDVYKAAHLLRLRMVGVPAGLEEIAQLGRTLWRRRADILAFFDHHAANGSTEAINGRLEALMPQRPRIPQPHALPLALTPALRHTPPTHRCTVNYEERANLAGD